MARRGREPRAARGLPPLRHRRQPPEHPRRRDVRLRLPAAHRLRRQARDRQDPVFGWFYRLSGNLIIDRGDARQARGSLDAATAAMRDEKIAVWFMPEGHRNTAPELLCLQERRLSPRRGGAGADHSDRRRAPSRDRGHEAAPRASRPAPRSRAGSRSDRGPDDQGSVGARRLGPRGTCRPRWTISGGPFEREERASPRRPDRRVRLRRRPPRDALRAPGRRGRFLDGRARPRPPGRRDAASGKDGYPLLHRRAPASRPSPRRTSTTAPPAPTARCSGRSTAATSGDAIRGTASDIPARRDRAHRARTGPVLRQAPHAGVSRRRHPRPARPLPRPRPPGLKSSIFNPSIFQSFNPFNLSIPQGLISFRPTKREVAMVPVMSLWLPILLSAVVVFVASSIIHMVLSLPPQRFQEAAGREGVLAALRKSAVPAGDYVFPKPDSMKAMKDPAFLKRWSEGPVGYDDRHEEGRCAVDGKASRLLVSPLCRDLDLRPPTYAGRALQPGAPYLSAFRFASAVAFVGYGLGLWQNTIWYGRSWTTTFKTNIDALYLRPPDRRESSAASGPNDPRGACRRARPRIPTSPTGASPRPRGRASARTPRPAIGGTPEQPGHLLLLRHRNLPSSTGAWRSSGSGSNLRSGSTGSRVRPARLILPIRPWRGSVNQTFPSWPALMPQGLAERLYSASSPPGVRRPILLP